MRVILLRNLFKVFLCHPIAADGEERKRAGLSHIRVEILKQFKIAHAAVDKNDVALFDAGDLRHESVGDRWQHQVRRPSLRSQGWRQVCFRWRQARSALAGKPIA